MSKTSWTDVGVAIAIALPVGMLVGLGIGLLARQLGWATNLVPPITGGVVGMLVPLIYVLRQNRRPAGR